MSIAVEHERFILSANQLREDIVIQFWISGKTLLSGDGF